METAWMELALLCAVPADLDRTATELAGSLSTGECAGCSGPPTSLASRHNGPSPPCNMPPPGPTEGRADKGRAEREAQRVASSPRRNRARERVSRPIRGRTCFGRAFGTTSCETAPKAAREAMPKAPLYYSCEATVHSLCYTMT
jgi:hypothetical protein